MLSTAEATTLLDLADESIVEGLRGGRAVEPPEHVVTGGLARVVGAFVTVDVRGELNGCIGHIEGIEPLARSVPRLAWSAAFADPRLPPLQAREYAHAELKVSVLSALYPAPSGSRAALLDHLRPGVDGLVVGEGRRRAVFLPAVWAQLPDPDDFLDHLWRKAGMPPGHWPSRLEASCFTVAEYTRPVGTGRRAATA